MEKRELTPGDIVQIDPEHDICFGGCLMMVMEPKSFGAQGFVAIPKDKKNPPSQAWYRCDFEHMEFVGAATFVPRDIEP